MRYFLFFSSMVFFACSSNEKQAGSAAKAIEALEAEIGADPAAPADRVKSLIEAYEAYSAHENADTQLVVDHWLRAGEMAARVQDFEQSLGFYDKILANYPLNPKAPRALFMKAFTLDSQMGKLEEARAVYEAFLAKYPNDDFADDAAFSLKNLGKTPEEIIKGFEAQQPEK